MIGFSWIDADRAYSLLKALHRMDVITSRELMLEAYDKICDRVNGVQIKK